MGMRITTNMMMNSYRFDLMNATNTLAGSRDKVITQRKFNSYSEDPTTATHAWRIRRAYAKNESYKINNSDTGARFNIAWETLGSIKTNLYDANAKASAVSGLTDSTASARQPLGKVLSNTADSVIQAMNSAKYGDHYVFSGENALNVPFTWEKKDGKDVLLYRGVDVNAKKVDMPDMVQNPRPDWAPQSADDYSLPEPGKMPATSNDPKEQEWIDYYSSDWAKLQALAHEETNVDLGMGLEEDGTTGELIDGTAFNMALPGIAMLGYGVDEDGLPYNGVMAMKALGEIFDRCDPKTGEYASKEDEANANKLLDRISDVTDYVSNSYSQVDTKKTFLNSNETRLKSQGDYLMEEILNLEQIDMADAITSFSWDYYCYNAALKIGNQLLSQSLIDYMN